MPTLRLYSSQIEQCNNTCTGTAADPEETCSTTCNGTSPVEERSFYNFDAKGKEVSRGKYLIGYVEFDDQGWFHDPNQRKAIFDACGGRRSTEKSRPAIPDGSFRPRLEAQRDIWNDRFVQFMTAFIMKEIMSKPGEPPKTWPQLDEFWKGDGNHCRESSGMTSGR